MANFIAAGPQKLTAMPITPKKTAPAKTVSFTAPTRFLGSNSPTTTPVPATTTPVATEKPWYKLWWIWAAAGGSVVLLGGLGIAVAMKEKKAAPVSDCGCGG